ncbi:hypothetical protein JL49_13185 [Pseudoalteromonas luteoviolacea]|nr:hypothetical protein JL49_13185 [Pseudoalteromonas luteoviolacea]
MSKKSNNPTSIRPSAELKECLEKTGFGVSRYCNGLVERVSIMHELDAIALTKTELDALKTHLQSVFLDEIAIQVLPRDICEAECDTLTKKLQDASFGQVWSTLIKYELVKW